VPEKKTIERTHQDASKGKAPSTQAGEFVREEMEHVREGKHGARSAQQAIAIGLSKARRAGVKLPPPSKGKAPARTHAQAARDYRKGQSSGEHKPSARRSRGVSRALKREGGQAASHAAIGREGRPHEGRRRVEAGGAQSRSHPSGAWVGNANACLGVR
jgi:hypothetical protein